MLELSAGYSMTNLAGGMSFGGDIVPGSSDSSSSGVFDVVGENNSGLTSAKTDFTYGIIAHGIKLGISWYFMKGPFDRFGESNDNKQNLKRMEAMWDHP